jgi:hypothetical protein
VCIWCLTDKAFGQRCRDVDHVLAIVEYEQDLPVANKCCQPNEWVLGLHHQPECRRDRRWHELGIGQRREINEEDRPVKSLGQHMCDGHGNGGFAYELVASFSVCL